MKGDDKTDEADIAKLGTLRIGVPTEAGSKGNGILEATAEDNAAGIGGGSFYRNGSNIEIAGGEITAMGNMGAGIGSGYGGNGNNIKITGGKVTAKGRTMGAGIGGSGNGRTIVGDGNNIEISGGEVKAYGGFFAAGIGGGGVDNDMSTVGDGNKIKITGGVVEAYGGKDDNYGGVPAGIGGGAYGSGSSNTISGNAVVMATSGKSGTAALQGFDGASGGSIDKGVTFTGYGSNFDGDGRATDFVWDASGNMYDNVEISGNATFPASLTITTDSKLTVGSEAEITLASGANITVADGAELANDGTISDATEANIDNKGTISTKANFYLKETDKTPYTSQYQTYKTGDTVGTYTNLPNPDVEAKCISDIRADIFSNWYYLDGEEKVAIKDGDNVLLNQHTFYEETVPAPDPGPDPMPTDTVTLTFRTDEGSWNGITETTVTGAPDAVIIPPSYPYTDATRTCIGWFDEQGKEIVSGQTKFQDVTGVVTARFVDTPGWHQNATGWWYVYDFSNNYYTNCWALINSAWFYFNDAGYCLEYTWGYINGAWYFFGWGGYMQTGWQWLGGSWYFLDRNTGAMKCGWVHDGVWYYCDAALGGAMYDNCWAYINGAWYGFNEGGSMTQGWSYSYACDGWFYLDPETGHMLYGWQYIGGHWYYFYNNGLMAANAYVDTYWLGADGAWS